MPVLWVQGVRRLGVPVWVAREVEVPALWVRGVRRPEVPVWEAREVGTEEGVEEQIGSSSQAETAAAVWVRWVVLEALGHGDWLMPKMEKRKVGMIGESVFGSCSQAAF